MKPTTKGVTKSVNWGPLLGIGLIIAPWLLLGVLWTVYGAREAAREAARVESEHQVYCAALKALGKRAVFKREGCGHEQSGQ